MKKISKKTKKLTLNDLKHSRGGKATCTSGLVSASTQEVEAKNPEIQTKVAGGLASELDAFGKSGGL